MKEASMKIFVSNIAAVLLSVLLLGYGDIVRAETTTKKTVPVASVPTNIPMKLSRPLNLGKVVLTQFDPKKTLAQQFREAWDKKYGVGTLDRKFKVTSKLGGTTTVLTSPQSLFRWANQIAATKNNLGDFKVVFSPEVKLVLLREYGELALVAVDHQVDFNLAKYKGTLTNQNALNLRVDVYKNLVDHNLMAKTADLLEQIDAMIDRFFAQATDGFGGQDLVALASMLFVEETPESATVSEGTDPDKDADSDIDEDKDKDEDVECKSLNCAKIKFRSEDGIHSGSSTLVRLCCGCSGSGLGCLIGNNAAINEFANLFNSLYTFVVPLVDTSFNLVLKK